MSEVEQITKQMMMGMAIAEIEELLNIVSDLTFVGYKISLCKIKGFSHMQCAQKFNVPKHIAAYYWEKCKENSYDIALKKIFRL